MAKHDMFLEDMYQFYKFYILKALQAESEDKG